MPLYVLVRHAHSVLNLERRVNGDPSVPAGLTEEGRRQARQLGVQLAQVPLELVLHTRFPRARETAELALAARTVSAAVRAEVEPLLDDIDVGELDGSSIDDYRAWKREHEDRETPFPGGESLDDAARRYASAFRLLTARPERTVLVVCHEIPIRYALNAAAGSDDLDAPAHAIPNATPYLFDRDALVRAASRIDALAGTAQAESPPRRSTP
ncbi:MAG TPA: histidine phosphatase family protein [Gaiellaceae bacterium]|nr:histidine phosphatase family protein [Gaiellaceae bacterium]